MKYDKEASTRSLFTGQTEPLTFPLTRKFTEDLGDKRSETFLSKGFAKDPAAAYSLRALGSYNEPVVRVRREPHDTDATINDEQNFTASQVSGGELENWVNGKLETTLPADVATAAAAYSLRKVNSSYGVPTTKLDGSDGFPSNLNDLPLGNYSNAISGSTFTVGHFSTNSGAADSVSLSLGNNSFILRANKATSGTQYGHVIRVQGLSVGKRYTVTGEFKVTKGNGSGTVRAAVDISDATSETDEKSIATTNSTFTPFEVTALFNDSTANVNFIDFTLNDFGGANSGSGPIEGEFRNIKIVESDNRVVRLRRSSDDVEVDVDFDTEGKLSSSSLIGDITEQGGESGSTSATDLNGFLNESGVNVGMGGNFFDQNSQATINATSSNGFTATVAKTNTNAFDIRASSQSYNNVKKGTVTISYNIVQNTLSNSFKIELYKLVGSDYEIVDTVPVGTTGSRSVTVENTNTNGDIFRLFSSSGTLNNGEVIQISDITITASKHTATVHTWYDQSGSNDAVQETAGNQPKIAESGALLADENGFPEIQFTPDASNGKFLSFTTINFSDTMGIFFKSIFRNSGGSSRTLSKDGSFTHIVQFLNAATVQINTTTDATFIVPNFTTSSKLHTILTASDSANYFGNAVTADSPQSVNMNSDFQLNQIGVAANSSGGARSDFDTSELIFYTSDQSNNRFKIESNINNYYGLYNDANDMAEAFRATAGTLTNESKDGFDLAVGTPTAYVGFEFNKKIANGDSVFISFNLDLTGGSGGDATPIMRLTKTTLDGTDSSNFINPSDLSQGFNSFELTSSDNDAKFFAISEGNDNVNISISDFKVSRIARNGFVQTWYDQSGNNRPMIQDNASEQPSIVENGGFVGGVKAKAATSDDTMQNLQVSTDGTTANFGTDDWASGANSKLGLMYVGKIDEVAVNTTQSIILGGGRGVSSFQSGGLSLQVVKGGDDTYRLTNERQGLTPSTMTTIVTLNTDDDMILYGTANNRDFTVKLNSTTVTETETADLDTRENQPLSLFGAYSGFNTRRYQNSSGGVCKECYLFAGDNISEVDTIATEINQHYNIY